MTVYSGRTTTISLPASDPDGTPVDIYVLTEPQGGAEALKLTGEQLVGISGQRRYVSARFSRLGLAKLLGFSCLGCCLPCSNAGEEPSERHIPCGSRAGLWQSIQVLSCRAWLVARLLIKPVVLRP